MDKQITKWIFLAMLTFGYLLKAQTLKIEECYESSKQNYPLIKQYGLIEKSLGYNLNNANKAYFPQLSVTGIGGYLLTGLPSLAPPGSPSTEESNVKFIGIAQLNQTIWDGGATKTQKEITKASSEVEKANVDVAIYALKERVNQLYFGILLIDEQLAQLDIQQDLLKKNLSKANAFSENGLAYKTDADELRAELLKTDQKKIEFTFARKGYIKMLSYMTNKSIDDQVKLEMPLDKLLNASGANRPEIILYENQKKLAAEQSKMNRVSTMPKFGLMGAGALIAPGIKLGSDEMSSIAIVGLSLSWNTTGLYRMSNNKQIHQLNIDKIANQQENFLFNNKLQLTQNNNDVEKKNAILEKDEEIVALRTNIRNAYQVKYDNGICSMNDLIAATDRESEAKSNKALHKIEWLLSSYQFATTNGN